MLDCSATHAAAWRCDRAGTALHGGALVDFVDATRSRLFAIKIMVGLEEVKLPGIDLGLVKDVVRHAYAAAKFGTLGCAIMRATSAGTK